MHYVYSHKCFIAYHAQVDLCRGYRAVKMACTLDQLGRSVHPQEEIVCREDEDDD
jgi:hypothetical protein